MVKVAGVWELGWNTPILEHDLWEFPLREFGVDEFIMTPITGIKKEVTEFNNIQEVIDANSDLTVILVDERGDETLESFEHPENVLYICGRASTSPYQSFKSEYRSLRIETPLNKGMIWPHQAMNIILYDRMKKCQ